MYKQLVVILLLVLLLVATDNAAAASPSRQEARCWGTMSMSYATYQLRDELSATVQFIASSIGVPPGAIISSLAQTGQFNYQSDTTSVQLSCQ